MCITSFVWKKHVYILPVCRWLPLDSLDPWKASKLHLLPVPGKGKSWKLSHLH